MTCSFSENEHVIPPSQLPKIEEMDYVGGGNDWGFTAPSTSYPIGMYKGVWYVLDEFYEAKVEIDRMGAEMNAQRRKYGVKRFWADSADPARISHYARSGLPVYPVVKPRVVQRCQYIDSLFAQGRLIISASCVNLIRELATYQWPEGVRDESKSNLVGDDHALDAIGYMLWSERRMMVAHQPQFPEDDSWGPKVNGEPSELQPQMTAGYGEN